MRAAFLLLSAAGFAFAALSLPSADSRQALQKLFRQVRAGETLPTAFLEAQAQRFEGPEHESCDGEAMLAIALIELKLAESALAEGHSDGADTHLVNASKRAREQLACSPTNGFAWLVAFWSEFLAGNLTEAKWSYIDASYRYAPHEAWVALIRLPLLAKTWTLIPEARRRLVLGDFKMLLNEGFVDQCAQIYAASSPRLQGELRDLLAEVPELQKQQFNFALRPLDVDPIATEKGEADAERLRKNMKGLSDALGRKDR